MKLKRQSGVLPYRMRKKRLEVLLVTSIETRRWVLPKGNVETGMTPRKSAEKEAFEEAGVIGKVGETSIGSYVYSKSERKNGAMCEVEVFPMEVKDLKPDYPEKKLRRREWMDFDRAAQAVSEQSLSRLITDFAARFGQPAAADDPIKTVVGFVKEP